MIRLLEVLGMGKVNFFKSPFSLLEDLGPVILFQANPPIGSLRELKRGERFHINHYELLGGKAGYKYNNNNSTGIIDFHLAKVVG